MIREHFSLNKRANGKQNKNQNIKFIFAKKKNMKPNKKIFSTIIFASLFMASIVTYGQINVQKDFYGRELIDYKGKKVNYSEGESKATSQNFKSDPAYLKISNGQQSLATKTPLKANITTLYSIMGTSIGRNSMHSIDIDNDGTVELICTASSQGFGSGEFWYIMHYNSTDNSCDQIWTSTQYSKRITTLEVIDINNDNTYEILLCFNDGTIQIYNGKTRELTKEVKPVNEQINSIVYADGNNDSKKDFVISCANNTYVVDPITYSVKSTITQGSNYVRVGNVDANPDNEIVLSYGAVYRITGSTVSNLWRFNKNGTGMVELSNIDGDAAQEIIFAESWYKINIYDADTKTTKYTITTDLDIQSLYLKDTNNDGVDEILYGDGQWGKVFCYDAVTRAKMWSVTNPEHGVAAINYADLNNDGKQELIWSAGWTSTGADYLYIHSVVDNKLLWRSDDIVGPFYAIAKGDVDQDGKDEIVAVSYESESGYGSGVLLIIDAQTNKLKWKSDGDFFYQVWTGIYDLAINDIDNDGQNEIIIAAGQTYTGKIWIVDGKNHSIKSSNLFTSDDIDEFYSLTVDDVDDDGEPELMAVSNSTLYAIRASDWAIKWKVSVPSIYYKPILRCADLDGDGKKETILCKGEIQIVNGLDQSYSNSDESNYNNFDLFDYNEDGVLDIVASTTNGHIVTIDGKTKNILKDINPETAAIASVRMQKLGNSIVYVYSCDGRINFYKNDSSCLATQVLGNKIGEIESLKIIDFQSDPAEILVGTPISVLRMNAKLTGTVLNTKSINSDVAINKSLQMYPNPAKNEIFLKKLDDTIVHYSFDLISSNGQFIKRNVQATNPVEKIDVTGLSPGIYLLRLNINDAYYLKKIIKE